MMKNETAAVAEKTAKGDRPYVFVDADGNEKPSPEDRPAGEKLRHLTTVETRRAVADIVPKTLGRGLMTTDLDRDLKMAPVSPAQYCVKFALPEEWAILQKIVAERMAKEPTVVWEKCQKCGYISNRRYRRGSELTKPGAACVKCNFAGYQDGGFMHDMTEAEVQADHEAKLKSEAEMRERANRAALYAENDRRQKIGIGPLTRAQWDARAKAGRVKVRATR